MEIVAREEEADLVLIDIVAFPADVAGMVTYLGRVVALACRG